MGYRQKIMVVWVGVITAVLLASCAGEEKSGATDECLSCHDVEASQHAETHRDAGKYGNPLACADCHPVPTSAKAQGAHRNGATDITFAGNELASLGGVEPSWDGERCQNVYCHGATLSSGSNIAPAWTDRGIECGWCHGDPPVADHPEKDNCAVCHQAVFTAQGELDLNQHLNGQLELTWDDLSCWNCHDVSSPAHVLHLKVSQFGKPLSCGECHAMPQAVSDLGHISGQAEVVFPPDGLAVTGDLVPSWDGERCYDVYCHGVTLRGGSNIAPRWNDTGLTCGWCHSIPPGDCHPTGPACQLCHADTIGADKTLDLDFHVNGVLDANIAGATCTDCHGQYSDGHAGSHLEDGPHTAALTCADCHPEPVDVGDPGHLDGTVDVGFPPDGLASTAGSNPEWDGASCSGVYCHGVSMSGGTNTTPAWTDTDLTCGWCHGLPPSTGHPDNSNCEICHGSAYSSPGVLDINLHIDGQVTYDGSALACLDCHTEFSDGHADAHLNASTYGQPLVCEDCHLVPLAWDDPGHLDGSVDVVFPPGSLATSRGCSPFWDGATCQDVYCHGARLNDGTNTTPAWTETPVACGWCHGLPPGQRWDGGGHSNSDNCPFCHGAAYVPPANTDLDPTVHLNGQVD